MKKHDSDDNTQFMPIGMCIGLSIGVALGAAMDISSSAIPASFKKAIMIADSQEANYQQALSGIACNLLGMCIYLSRNKTFISNDISTKINQAKMRIHEDISSIKPEDIAKSMHMSYSKFRKICK